MPSVVLCSNILVPSLWNSPVVVLWLYRHWDQNGVSGMKRVRRQSSLLILSYSRIICSADDLGIGELEEGLVEQDVLKPLGKLLQILNTVHIWNQCPLGCELIQKPLGIIC